MWNYSNTEVNVLLLKWQFLVFNITAYVFGLQISRNFFSNHDKCPGTTDASMLPVPETVELTAEDDIKDFGMHWCFVFLLTILWSKVEGEVTLYSLSWSHLTSPANCVLPLPE